MLATEYSCVDAGLFEASSTMHISSPPSGHSPLVQSARTPPVSKSCDRVTPPASTASTVAGAKRSGERNHHPSRRKSSLLLRRQLIHA